MAKVTASIPQGTRDFSADVVKKRQYIFNAIKNIFELYGFQPLETPAMENLDTLMGKYGDEGDKLIYRILNSGVSFTNEFFSTLFEGIKKYLTDNIINLPGVETDLRKLNPEVFAMLVKDLLSYPTLSKIYLPKLKNDSSNKALRYDLTIPFARYVAMNHGKLTFPFKRYQMQPVWRADRPQRGRYREFYQCDADVVGSNSLLNEVELINIYATVFEKLGMDVEIKINNRKILTGIAEVIGEPERIIDITVAIDKVDKIGINGVKEDLRKQGFNEEKIKMLNDFIFFEADRIAYFQNAQKENENFTKLNFIKSGSEYKESEILQKGVGELEYIITRCESFHKSTIKIDLSLARGLNYYTGTIFEVKAKNIQMGSIGGGGRYDDLTGLFGVPNIPGVGISFGVDRIYDVMEELKLFPAEVQTGTQVLFFNLGEAESKAAFILMQQLRNKGISCEIFHEAAKFDKQFKYAEKKGISYAVIIGAKELEDGNCQLKNLHTGVQQTLSQNDLPFFAF